MRNPKKLAAAHLSQVSHHPEKLHGIRAEVEDGDGVIGSVACRIRSGGSASGECCSTPQSWGTT